MSTARPLKVKLEFRAITNSHLNRESAVVISSTMPSAKYSCSGSPHRDRRPVGIGDIWRADRCGCGIGLLADLADEADALARQCPDQPLRLASVADCHPRR